MIAKYTKSFTKQPFNLIKWKKILNFLLLEAKTTCIFADFMLKSTPWSVELCESSLKQGFILYAILLLAFTGRTKTLILQTLSIFGKFAYFFYIFVVNDYAAMKGEENYDAR